MSDSLKAVTAVESFGIARAARVVATGVEQGIPWVTVVGPMYNVNGYAQIPTGHPWLGTDCDEMPVDVHGGLTFGGKDGWVGFDTMHAGDVWPDTPISLKQIFEDSILWTPEMVAEEARSLARQIAEAHTEEIEDA